MTRSFVRNAIPAVCWGMIVSACVAQSDDSTSVSQAKATLKFTGARAAQYKVVIAESGTELQLRPTPVLSWSNPAAGEIYGNVYVWTLDGRPFVVGSLYKWFSPHTHSSSELQSLSQSNLLVNSAEHPPWHPKGPGLSFQELPRAPNPASSSTRRLLQMRQITRQLTARKTDREGVERQLRLLAQPVYRYGRAGSAVIDGALFAFVQGTDPEVWVMLEAYDDSGTPRWRLGFARMNSVTFVVSRNGGEIWRADLLPWGTVKNRDQPYTTFRSDEIFDTGN